MEMLTGKLVGKLRAGRWAQIYDFEPDVPEKAATRGRLVAAVSFETNEELTQIQTVETGREILSRIGELYFGNEIDSPMESLKKTLEKIREEFDRVEFQGLVMAGDYIYIGVSSGGVWIKTDTRQGYLADPEQDTSGIKVFSGKAREGLTIVLGNRGLWQKVKESDITEATRRRGEILETVTETLNAGLHTGEGGNEAGVVICLKKSIVVPEVQAEVSERATAVSERVGEIKQKWLAGITQRIYLRHGDRQLQRKQMLYLGLGFLILLLILAGLGQWRKQVFVRENSQINKQIEKLEFDFQQAKATVEIDPQRSRDLLAEIKQQLEKLPKEDKKDPRIGKIEEQIGQVDDEAYGRTVLNLTEVVDLKLIRQDLVGDKLELGGEKLTLLDSGTGRIAEIDINTGSGKITGSGEELKGAGSLAIYSGRVLVAGEKGIYETGGSNIQLKNKEDWNLLTIKRLEVWTGNLYVLDAGSGSGTIWRYQASGTGFSARQSWTKEGDGPQLANAADMAIDGSIWVIGDQGGEVPTVYKYTRGVKEVWEASGFGDNWKGGRVKIYTDDESKNIYIWEEANQRIIGFEKSGKYVKQWKNEKLGSQLKDLTVDEKNNRIFLTDGTKIYKGEL